MNAYTWGKYLKTLCKKLRKQLWIVIPTLWINQQYQTLHLIHICTIFKCKTGNEINLTHCAGAYLQHSVLSQTQQSNARACSQCHSWDLYAMRLKWQIHAMTLCFLYCTFCLEELYYAKDREEWLPKESDLGDLMQLRVA